MVSEKLIHTIIYLKEIHNLSIKEYCISFSKKFNINLLSKEKIDNIIEENLDNDFFPEALNMKRNFEQGNIDFILSYFLLFEEINNNFIKLYRDVENECLFTHNSLYKNASLLFKIIDSKMDILLSENEENNVLSFLFLNFLPIFKNYELLYDIKTKNPLVCFPKITIENFKLLIYLMKDLDKNKFDELNSNKNLNHLLVELFFSDAISKIDINYLDQKQLTKEKINILFEHEISIKNIEVYLPKHVTYSFEKEITEFKQYEAVYFSKKLESELKIKAEDKKKTEYLKV